MNWAIQVLKLEKISSATLLAEKRVFPRIPHYLVLILLAPTVMFGQEATKITLGSGKSSPMHALTVL